jgi:uncharacterized protein
MPNRLANESSPYLLQHAHNPVDWFGWGPEALQKARTENKPILVSIGYSACHWCHVMERESFENEDIAQVMNETLVCIKIDREERPDIDSIYMDALHAMGGQGGWPLNVFLMPDTKPFYGLTYLPPQNWVQLVRSVGDAFANNAAQLQQSAEGFAQNLRYSESEKYGLEGTENEVFSNEDLDEMFERMKPNFDLDLGGSDRAPKFPMPAIYKFLMRYYAVSKNPEALRHVELTLNAMAQGGIYDHVGGGWARYSVDAEWFIPHFEKMLYDNAQLIGIYSEAYTLTKKSLYKQRVTQTIDWLTREMSNGEGGFCAALDADSEGVEGKFYVWTAAELQQTLGNDYTTFAKHYNIKPEGNWEHGYNHLHLGPAAAAYEGQEVLSKLFEARSTRIRPATDDKTLSSWNGLLLKGLTDAYRALGDENHRVLAVKLAHFIQSKMTTDGQLWHSYKNEKTTIMGFLEDYAAVIEGYLGLYQVSFEEQWLDEALKLTAYSIENFYDVEDELFMFCDRNAEPLIAQKKEILDNVVPSSNATMAHNLYTLGLLCHHDSYIQTADLMLSKMKKMILTDVQWVANWAALYALRTQPTAEVSIVGPAADEFRKSLEMSYIPNKVLAGTNTTSDLPLLENRTAIGGQTTIYVCKNRTCQLPVKTVAEALEQLRHNE